MFKLINCLCVTAVHLFLTFVAFLSILGYGNTTPPTQPPAFEAWALDILTFPTFAVLGATQSLPGPGKGLAVNTAELLFLVNSLLCAVVLTGSYSVLRAQVTPSPAPKAK